MRFSEINVSNALPRKRLLLTQPSMHLSKDNLLTTRRKIRKKRSSKEKKCLYDKKHRWEVYHDPVEVNCPKDGGPVEEIQRKI